MSSPLERARELLEELETLDTDARAARLLELAKTDPDAHAEVISLLPHLDESGTRFEDVDLPVDRAAIETLLEEKPAATDPESIGQFRILRRLGEGGMGIVYVAEQQSPRRTVALKVMQRSSIRESLLKRFRREAEILGRLEHPGIARIIEAGTFEDQGGARPYFAMEFVDGRPLTEFADDRDLSLNERLNLFARVCDAVHHAHEQGVIHRDLKPDNILVTPEGHPKVLDFGVARATDADIQAVTLVTEVGQIMGTLPYMSPEQVAGDPAGVGTRSDVYALGVILFELLCGRRPHDISKRSMPEAARVIREEDATPLGSVAMQFRGEVEVMVGKALEKDANRRYASAADLAADVRRYLALEPITARAPSRLYLLRKLVRRQPGLVAGVGLALLSLSIGIVLATRFGLDEARQRATAERAVYRTTLEAAASALDTANGGAAARLLAEAPPHLRGWEWRHLTARAVRHLWEADVLDMPAGAPVAFSVDGRRVFAPLDERTIGVFDADSGETLRRLEVSSPVVAELFQPTNQGLVVATEPDRLLLIDDSTGEQLHEHTLPGQPTASDWDPVTGHLAVVCAIGERTDEGIPFLLLTGALTDLRARLQRRAPSWRNITWTRAGRNLVSSALGGWSSWDTSTWERTRTGLAAGGFANDASANELVLGTSSGAVLLFDQDALEQPRFTQRGHTEKHVDGVGISRDGRVVASATREGRLLVWDGRTGEILEALTHRGSGRPRVAVSVAGTRVAVNVSGRLAVSSPHDEPILVLPGPGEFVYSVAWSPDARTLVARSWNGAFRSYDPLDGHTLLESPAPPRDELLRTAPWGLTTDGRAIVTMFCKPSVSSVSVLDLDAGTEFRPYPPDASATPETASSPTLMRRRFLAATGAVREGPWSGGDSPEVRFTRRSANHPAFETDPSGTMSIDFQASSLVDLSRGVEVPLVDESLMPGLPKRDRRHVDASFSPDGTRVAVARPTLGLWIHDTTTGERLGELSGHSGRVYTVAFSPDGTRIASGGRDRTIRIWDADAFEPIVTLRGHTSYVKDVAWSPDGRSLASASGDGTVRIWSSISVVERLAMLREDQRLRDEQRAFVEALFAELEDPLLVATAVREADLDDARRHASLRVVREIANVRAATR